MDHTDIKELLNNPEQVNYLPVSGFFTLISLYEIEDLPEVGSFLESRTALIPLLIEAWENLSLLFEGPILRLSLGYFMGGENEDEKGLWVDIKKDLPENILQQAQTTFDFQWWYNAQYKHDITRSLNFSVASPKTLRRYSEPLVSKTM